MGARPWIVRTGESSMKYLMVVIFALIPALIASLALWSIFGPFTIVIGVSTFLLGLDVCLNEDGQ